MMVASISTEEDINIKISSEMKMTADLISVTME